MGLINPNITSFSNDTEFENVSEHKVVEVVMQLAEYAALSTNNSDYRSVLREVDKVLMEWSRCGCLKKF